MTSGRLQLIGNVSGADVARKTKRIFIGYGRDDEHVPGLVYAKRFCARPPLARPFMFGQSFSSARQREATPAASGAIEFRPRGRPQPSEDTPRCPTCPGRMSRGAG